MSWASAIGAAEPMYGIARNGTLQQAVGPFVFHIAVAEIDPDRLDLCPIPQVVDMPVVLLLLHQMPLNPGPHTSWTEGTAEIQIVSALKINRTQSPDGNSRPSRQKQQQTIGARGARQDGFHEGFYLYSN